MSAIAGCEAVVSKLYQEMVRGTTYGDPSRTFLARLRSQRLQCAAAYWLRTCRHISGDAILFMERWVLRRIGLRQDAAGYLLVFVAPMVLVQHIFNSLFAWDNATNCNGTLRKGI